MKKVYCIGELLIDFVAENQGSDLSKAKQFTKKAGGAPANVAAAIAKLNGHSEFVGAVGKDAFGDFLVETLRVNGVKTNFLQRSDVFTTLAFVSLAEDGERDFVFNRGADMELRYNEELKSKFNDQIVHFGAATSFLGGNLEDAYAKYLNDAKTQHALISFDPNYRADLWKEKKQEFVQKCIPFIKKSDFAKFSEEEALLISGKESLESACAVFHDLGVKLIAITLGEKGTFLSNGKENTIISSVSVKAIDTTGAGDAFVGCFLYLLSLKEAPKAVLNDFSEIIPLIKKANKAGAVTTTKFGAINALPLPYDLGL